MANTHRKPNKRRRSLERRTGSKTRADKRINRSIIKLLICFAIFAAAVLIKLMFPETAESANAQVMSILGEDIDYKAAVVTLGEGLSGEKEFREAMAEACEYAFAMNGKISEETKEGKKPQGEKETSAETENAAEETVIKSKAEDKEDKAAKAVAAYIESIGEYASLELPAQVTYDMPEIGFECMLPAKGTLTSKFGYRMHPIDNEVKFHYGIDVGAAEGTEVVSFADGKVSAAGESTTLGKYLIIAHADGAESLYAHCSEFFVSSGDTVKKGQKIAAMGQTGAATGSNLHFELRVNDLYVNPQYYVTW